MSVERLPIDRMTVSTPSMRQLLRQAGWQGEPLFGVKLADPTWTCERWDQAQGRLQASLGRMAISWEDTEETEPDEDD